MASQHHDLWLWKKQQDWWIAVLFMIGSALFALGCVLYLCAVEHELILDSVFFTGSLFFTSAAYCQYRQSLNAEKIVFYSALSQFIGTLLFNMNTFDSFFNMGWLEQNLLIWTPNILGSILFQISGSLAMRDTCKRWWCWNIHSIDWWVSAINFTGCVAFLISAVLSFVFPAPLPEIFATLATTFTLLGACCFFSAAFLIWYKIRNINAD